MISVREMMDDGGKMLRYLNFSPPHLRLLEGRAGRME